MTIVNTPCFLFVYDHFTKEMISDIIQLEEGQSLVSNYDVTGKSAYFGETQVACEAKIAQLNLIIPEY